MRNLFKLKGEYFFPLFLFQSRNMWRDKVLELLDLASVV